MVRKKKETSPGLFDKPKTAQELKMEGVQNLYNFLFEACNIIRGPVSQDNFKDYITPILYYKRISDVYDEETLDALQESGGDEEYASLPEQHRFVIPDGCHWQDVRERTENLGAAIVGAMRGIELANPDTLYGVLSMFSAQKWTDKKNLSDGKIRDLIEHLSTRKLGNKDYPTDLMGDAYEILLKKFADDSKAKAGEYILGLTQNSKVGNYDDTLLLSGFADRTLGATISGTWNATAIEESLGDDFGVATFPTVTYSDGSVVQPSPIVNFNIYGINAQTEYPLESMLLAKYLTSEKVQKIRFEERNSTPVNKALVEDEVLLSSSPAVATLAKQTALASTVQPSIPQIANFWSPMEAFGQDCIAGSVTTDNLQEKLDTLVESILATID